jgi:hypothetical protein
MIIFVNSNGEIHDVETNSLNDESLTAVEVTDGTFDKWSKAKICCYKVSIVDGRVYMLTPYVDSRLIMHIDQIGTQTEVNAVGINDNSLGLFDVASLADENSQAIMDLADLIAEKE